MTRIYELSCLPSTGAYRPADYLEALIKLISWPDFYPFALARRAVRIADRFRKLAGALVEFGERREEAAIERRREALKGQDSRTLKLLSALRERTQTK